VQKAVNLFKSDLGVVKDIFTDVLPAAFGVGRQGYTKTVEPSAGEFEYKTSQPTRVVTFTPSPRNEAVSARQATQFAKIGSQVNYLEMARSVVYQDKKKK